MGGREFFFTLGCFSAISKGHLEYHNVKKPSSPHWLNFFKKFLRSAYGGKGAFLRYDAFSATSKDIFLFFTV